VPFIVARKLSEKVEAMARRDCSSVGASKMSRMCRIDHSVNEQRQGVVEVSTCILGVYVEKQGQGELRREESCVSIPPGLACLDILPMAT
jgi:hypothetical protein